MIKEQYRSLSFDENKDKSKQLFKKLSETSIFKRATDIMVFWSLRDEPYTHEFCKEWSFSKNIYLPTIHGESLNIRQFNNESDLMPDNKLGILEPSKGKAIKPEDLDLILVPGLGFDKDGNRLGRGKGFYDRFLPQTRAYKIGICYQFQVLEQIPTDIFDIKMDEIIFV